MPNLNDLPLDENNKPAIGAYDPVSHTIVAIQAGTVTTDASTGTQYAPVITSNGGGGSSDVSIHDYTTTSNHLAVNASGQITEANSGAISQAAGAQGDAAWSGSGNASIVAALKAIYAHLGNVGVSSVTNDGTSTTAITASVSANTVVTGSAGRLASILVTITGTSQLIIYDNASVPTGTIIGIVPANALVGTVVAPHTPAANGIVVAGNASNPGVTISWS